MKKNNTFIDLGKQGKLSLNNKLNELTGKEWIKFTKSWFIHHPPRRKEEEILHPYSDEAVFKAATSKWIRELDLYQHHRTWAGRVMNGFAEGVLRNVLAEYRLDWLIAPPQPGQESPREEIRERFEGEMQAKVGEVGAKLLSAKIDLIDVRARDEKTTEQLS